MYGTIQPILNNSTISAYFGYSITQIGLVGTEKVHHGGGERDRDSQEGGRKKGKKGKKEGGEGSVPLK